MADTRSYEIQLVSLLKSIGRALGGSGGSSSISTSSSSGSSSSSSQVAEAIRGVSTEIGKCYSTLSTIVGSGVQPEDEEDEEETE